MKDLKYILKRILIGVGIGIILMLFRSNVFAENYTPTISNAYGYVDTNNNYRNLTSTLATINSGGMYWNRLTTSDPKVRIDYSSLTIENGTYNIQFVTYSGVTNYVAYIRAGTILYTCHSESAFGIIGAPNSSNGGFYGPQIYICENVKLIANQTTSLFFSGNFFDSTGTLTYDFYITQILNVEKVKTTSEEITESQRVCEFYDKNSIKNEYTYLTDTGAINSYIGAPYGITDYIKITSSDKLYILTKLSSGAANYCFYNVNKTVLSCLSSTAQTIGELNIPDNTSYIRFTIKPSEDKPQYKICRNGNQAIADSQKELNDTLTSDTTPSSTDTNNAYSNFDESTAKNGVITQLITLPVQLFTSISTNLNTSCTRFDLGTLMGTHIYFNCINPANYLGNQLWSVIDILASGFFVWYLAKKFIQVFENLSSMKEGDPVGD